METLKDIEKKLSEAEKTLLEYGQHLRKAQVSAQAALNEINRLREENRKELEKMSQGVL